MLHLQLNVALGNAYATLTSLATAQNRPFYRYCGHIEFIRFKEYYGMPRGPLLSIHGRFSG